MAPAHTPRPLSHYAQLRKLLIQHAEHFAKNIDARREQKPVTLETPARTGTPACC